MAIPHRVRIDPVGATKTEQFKANADLNFTIENTTFIPSKSALVFDMHLPLDNTKYLDAVKAQVDLYNLSTPHETDQSQIASFTNQAGYYIRSGMNAIDYTKITVNNTNVVHTKHTNLTTNLLANSYEQNNLDTTTNWYLSDKEVARVFRFGNVSTIENGLPATAIKERVIQWVIPISVVDAFLDQEVIYGTTALQINMHLLSQINFLFGLLSDSGELFTPMTQGGKPYEGWYLDNCHLLLKTENIKQDNFSLTGTYINMTQANRTAKITNTETPNDVNYQLSDPNTKIIGECFIPVNAPQLMISPFKTHQIQLTPELAIPATEPGNRQECYFSTLDALDKIEDFRTGCSHTLKHSYSYGVFGDMEREQFVNSKDELVNLNGTTFKHDIGSTCTILYDLQALVGDKGADLNKLPKNITFKLVSGNMPVAPTTGTGLEFNRFAITISDVTLRVNNNTADVIKSVGY